MTRYVFRWDAFVTAALVDLVATAAGVDQATAEAARPLLASVLSSVGGLPVSEEIYAEADRTAFATRLLGEALRHLAGQSSGRSATGWGLVPSVEAPGRLLRAHQRLGLNTASAAQLETLPDVGPDIAERIVDERRRRGPFRSVEELDTRVAGIGPATVRRIAELVSADDVRAPLRDRLPLTGDLATDLAALVAAMPGPDAADRLSAALDLLTQTCAAEPHPFTAHGRVRALTEPAPEPSLDAEWVAALVGEDYYARLPTLLDEAQTQITVCMFHVAFPGPAHPTRVLLDALVAAQERGVAVRVLVDRDRDTDPYRSTVINSAAKRYLADNGVPIRSDDSDRLLHSKFVTIDDATAVIGSHNWSAGSYSEFDDISLVVRSATFVASLHARFTPLWGP